MGRLNVANSGGSLYKTVENVSVCVSEKTKTMLVEKLFYDNPETARIYAPFLEKICD